MKRVRVWLLAMGLAHIALPGFGCRDLLGIERLEPTEEDAASNAAASTSSESATSTVTGAGGAGGSGPSPCDACVAVLCPDAGAACNADPKCAAAIECMLAEPGDPVARVACLAVHANAANEDAFDELDACLRDSCLDGCYEDADGLFAAYDLECRACLVEQASDALDTCVTDASCERLAVEALANPDQLDPRTTEPLFFAFGDDGAAKRALGEAFARCSEPCGNGRRLECVRRYDWARPEPGVAAVDFEIEVPVVTLPSFEEEPHAGIQIDACELGTAECEVGSTFTTDGDGLAKGQLSIVGLLGFRGFFRVAPGTSNQELYPVHLFAGRPVAGPLHAKGYAFTPDGRNLFASQAPGGGGVPAGKAMVFFSALDCATVPAPELTLEVSNAFRGDGAVVYITGNRSTGPDGLAWVLGAEPGCADFRFRDKSGNVTHRARVYAAPDVMTLAAVFPRTTVDDPVHGCTLDFPLDDEE